MKRYIIQYILFLLPAVIVGNRALAQGNSIYFMQGVAERNVYNPAFQTPYNLYINLPVISNLRIAAGNNSIVLDDVVFKKNIGGIDSTITFLHPQAMGKRDDFFKSLRNTTRIYTDIRTDILGFGFRKDKNFFTFNIGVNAGANVYLPKDLFSMLLYGTGKKSVFDISSFGIKSSAYAEVGLGYSRKLNDKLTVGGKLKYLAGYFNVNSSIKDFKITAGADRWRVSGNGKISVSLPSGFDTEKLFKPDASDPNNKVLDFDNIGDVFDFGNMQASKIVSDLFSNPGAGLDLGVTYNILPELQFSAAVTDLGFIRWTNNTASTTIKKDWTFEGVEYIVGEDENDIGDKFEEELDKLGEIFSKGETGKSYTASLNTRFNAGLEYGLLKDKIGIGLLYSALFSNKNMFSDLTLSANFRPCNWFQPTISYSVLDGRFHTVGAGLQLKAGALSLHLAAEKISIGPKSWISSNGAPIPKYSNGAYLHFGLSLVFGDSRSRKNKDDDGDGIKNKKDRCPDTPAGYLVDKDGCTIDGDKDGIPDNLDKCPNTPAGVAVDGRGCPFDTDGDGILDYQDKCPDTPTGVAVNEHGCPIDSDGDSVPDYLDKCANTPAEAYSTIDGSGCPKDTDGDGVPDYLDKCPNTPAEAYSAIDESGCPKDTDGDGILDYQDKCPTVSGTVANEGCPELKKTEREVLEKALHGIQFETGKAVLKKSSFPILNEIVSIMYQNPTYNLIVNGHTDNVGKPASNFVLSENRANAVKKYLIDAGVEESRITAYGSGDTQPAVPNTTKANKALNRRVEFLVKYKKVE